MSMYTTVNLDTTYTQLWCTHYAWISCIVVHFYCTPVCAHLYCKLVQTNESSSEITFMNRVDQSQLRILGITIIPIRSLITEC